MTKEWDEAQYEEFKAWEEEQERQASELAAAMAEAEALAEHNKEASDERL